MRRSAAGGTKSGTRGEHISRTRNASTVRSKPRARARRRRSRDCAETGAGGAKAVAANGKLPERARGHVRRLGRAVCTVLGASRSRTGGAAIVTVTTAAAIVGARPARWKMAPRDLAVLFGAVRRRRGVHCGRRQGGGRCGCGANATSGVEHATLP